MQSGVDKMNRLYKWIGVILCLSACVGIALVISVTTPVTVKGQEFIMETTLPETSLSEVGYLEEVNIDERTAITLGEMFGFTQEAMTYVQSEKAYVWNDGAGNILKICNGTGHIMFSTKDMLSPHEKLPTENESIEIARTYIENIRGKTMDLIVEHVETLCIYTGSKNDTTISEKIPLSVCVKFRQVINNRRVVCGGGILINIGPDGALLGYTQYTVRSAEFLNTTIVDSKKGFEKIKEKGVIVSGEKPDCRVVNVTLVYYYNPYDERRMLRPSWEYTLLPAGREDKPIRKYVDGISGEVII